ncbi:MAG TPA: hypothetical protein VK404_04495 [Spirosoma sp.]|nr:hypothetical protein [Spirosoma sp.]
MFLGKCISSQNAAVRYSGGSRAGVERPRAKVQKAGGMTGV